MSRLSGSVRVARVLLDDPQVDPGFQQMGGVRMAQGVDMGALVDATLLEGPTEGTLQTAAGDRAAVVGQAVLQTVTGGCGEQPQR